MSPSRRLFIAGSTGAVGRTLVRLAGTQRVDFVAHRRPKPDGTHGGAVFDLADVDALAEAIRACTTIVQLIGTTRERFAAGDTYETSDIGTTHHLVAGARRTPTVDHLVLLSSVGAGKPMGAYLQAKAAAEAIARQSGIPWTIFRPSAFVGEGHKPFFGMGAMTRTFGMARWRPIHVDQLAAAILHVSLSHAPLGTVLEGRSLWETVSAAEAPAVAALHRV